MLLRSSSTPILGSLRSSSAPFFLESPNNNSSHHHNLERSSPSSSPFLHAIANHPNASLHCHFSPLSDSSDRDPSSIGFRRTLSEGNLKSLLPDDSHHPPSKTSSAGRRANPSLKTIPSLPRCHSEEEEEPQEDEEDGGDELKRNDRMGESITGEFGFSDENPREIGEVGVDAAPPLFLARGLGIDRLGSGILNAGGGGGGGGGKCPVLTGNGGEQSDMETYYKRMVDENSGNALFLRNYAQFLYQELKEIKSRKRGFRILLSPSKCKIHSHRDLWIQTKGDPQRAEEYYSRAMLAEPGDGEILSQYAKLVWELHQDVERASSYFEQAVQATPHDSHVLAAYARFMWETEDNAEVEGGEGRSRDYPEASIHHGPLASAATS